MQALQGRESACAINFGSLCLVHPLGRPPQGRKAFLVDGRAGFALHDSECLGQRHRATVRVIGGQGVEYICGRDDTSFHRYAAFGQSVRIAATVQFLVVTPGDRRQILERVDPGEDLMRVNGVQPDLFPFLFVQLAGPVANRVADTEPADVVQKRSPLQSSLSRSLCPAAEGGLGIDRQFGTAAWNPAQA